MYPLLVQGYFSNANGTNASLVIQAGPATQQWSNILTKGRGNLKFLDIVAINNLDPLNSLGPTFVTLSLGGTEIVTNGLNVMYGYYSQPGYYNLIPIDSPGGQNIQLVHTIPNGAGGGIVVCAYYENKAATNQLLLAALRYSALKQRVQDFWQLFNLGVGPYLERLSITVPTGKGNVVGIAILAYFNDPSGLAIARPEILVRVQVNGNLVVQDAPLVQFLPQSTRTNMYPILIPGGMEVVVSINGSGLPPLTGIVWAGVRFYYDELVDGSNPYGL